MSSQSLLGMVLVVCIGAVLIGVFFDLGVGFISIPLIITYLFALNLFYTNTEGPRKLKIARLLVFLITYCLMILSFSWISISVFRDYLGGSFFELLYNLEGYQKLIVFGLYFGFCIFLWFYNEKIADSLLKGFLSLYNSSSIEKRAHILYFLILYFSTILFFAIAYHILYELSSTSFASHLEVPIKFHDFLYFSIVTSTSYGTDLISPLSLPVRALVVLQIIISVVLLMIYISHVMSLSNDKKS
jgi:hypothetical protein